MLDGVLAALAPAALAFGVVGVVVGIVFGAIPGLTATLAIALFVPVTFAMEPANGLIMLGGIYAGAIFGGSISAVLINVPGTPASIITGWEGHAMARQGQAPYALGLAAVSSGVGGLVSALVMLFLAPVVARLALTFGPAEFVALLVFSLVVVVVMLETPLARNLAGCAIGLALGTIGLDPVNGVPRFTFGVADLASGLNLVAVLIGFFCMTQALVLAREAAQGARRVELAFGGVRGAWRVLATVVSHFRTYLRACSVGLFLGVMPAIGPESTPFVAHAVEKRFSREPERFGRGSPAGLLAAEASVSANVGGSLIPLLSLGIPGSGAAAMFIGALTLHGLRPGPLLFTERGDVVYAFLGGFVVANLAMMLIGLFAIRYFAVALLVPKGVIASFVALFSLFGAYAVNNSLFDVGVMFAAAALALALRAVSIPILPVVLALILGGLLEENLVVFAITVPTLEALLARPIAVALFAVTALILALTVWRRVPGHPRFG
ncbi:C4-dicarboxylate ABC transporter permease [Caldovatus sediminis]|uniref:C4-dicarboxylate ABC transporter permease n=1 Tax=Caldovatus sediminis TaxID=2041189 RepID=A0A8J2ZDT6_9PROT|nr:tripartite tricarboxylate transporter permease [Caldovatus sediminis]GGG44305.1 C4-dicarboxylate ABC transporter permease [Caldovatus sediminis]